MASPNPFATTASKSLRDEAFLRAQTLRSTPPAPHIASSMTIPSAPPPPFLPLTSSWHGGNAGSASRPPTNATYAKPPSNSYFATAPSTFEAPQKEAPPPAPQTMHRNSAPPVPTTPTHPASTPELIASARDQFHQNQGNAGQDVEDRRRSLSSLVTSSSNHSSFNHSSSNNYAASSNMMSTVLMTPSNYLPTFLASGASVSPTYSTKVITSEQRTDAAGSTYTTYLISIHGGPNPAPRQLEHRFSEFHALHTELLANHVLIPAPFPPKSLNGRMGNWTPSALLAPASQHKLIQDRVVRLDAWLLSVVEVLAGGGVTNKFVREEVSWARYSHASPVATPSPPTLFTRARAPRSLSSLK